MPNQRISQLREITDPDVVVSNQTQYLLLLADPRGNTNWGITPDIFFQALTASRNLQTKMQITDEIRGHFGEEVARDPNNTEPLVSANSKGRVDVVNLIGSLVTDQIGDSQITSAKIDNGTIQSVDIGQGVITGSGSGSSDGNIDSGTIAGRDLVSGTITSREISSSGTDNNARAVTSNSIRDGSVTGDKIPANAVGTSQLNTIGSLTTRAVSEDAIQTGAVTEDKISGGSVDSTRAVSTNKIQNGAVTEEKLAGGFSSGFLLEKPNRHFTSQQNTTTRGKRYFGSYKPHPNITNGWGLKNP